MRITLSFLWIYTTVVVWTDKACIDWWILIYSLLFILVMILLRICHYHQLHPFSSKIIQSAACGDLFVLAASTTTMVLVDLLCWFSGLEQSTACSQGPIFIFIFINVWKTAEDRSFWLNFPTTACTFVAEMQYFCINNSIFTIPLSRQPAFSI